MNKWLKVGEWLKDNGKGILGVAGAVATGNIPGGIAMIASMVSEATGEQDAHTVLEEVKNNPRIMVKLTEIANRDEKDIRKHHQAILELELQDKQKEHSEQQKTIRVGDTASDIYVRRTRPYMARLSLYATVAYVFSAELLSAFTEMSGANWEVALVLAAGANAYMGFRTLDKVRGTKFTQ